jgi:glycosyltransferase 2 family protein
MNPTARRVVIGIAVAALLLVYFLHGLDLGGLARTIAAADVSLLLAALATTIASYAARSWRWGEMLAPLARVKQMDLFSATMIGFASSLIVPRSGELLRPWLIAQRARIKASSAFATIVIERLVDLCCIVCMLALYWFVLPRPAAEQANHWVTVLGLGAAAAGGVLVVLAALLLWLHARGESAAAGMQRLLGRAPHWLAMRATALTRNFANGLDVLRAPPRTWVWIGLQSIAVWGLTALSLHLVQLAFGIMLPLQATLLLLGFVVVGESIPTPGLVGGFHALYLLGLTEVYGIDRQTAAAAVVAAHAVINLPPLFVGAACLPREGLHRLRPKRTQAANTR